MCIETWLEISSCIVPCLGIGDTKVHASKGICELVLEPTDPRDSAMITTAITVPKITSNQPAVYLSPDIRFHYRSIPLTVKDLMQRSVLTYI